MKMIISRRYIVYLCILTVIAVLVLAFGQNVGFNDVVKAGISGFVFALIATVLTFGYEDAKIIKEREEKRHDIFKGMYIEVSEFSEYLKNIDVEETLNLIPQLPHYAWDTAYTSGFIRPDDALCEKLRYVYARVSDIVYITNQTVQIRFSSNLPEKERKEILKSFRMFIQYTNKSLIPILEDVRNEIEERFEIPAGEVKKIREELQAYLSSLRDTTGLKATITQ
ncbi:MAG: hypothetical protein ABSF74_10475 [Dehalococcoidia bacterium]|jgi:hypothetical protein